MYDKNYKNCKRYIWCIEKKRKMWAFKCVTILVITSFCKTHPVTPEEETLTKHNVEIFGDENTSLKDEILIDLLMKWYYDVNIQSSTRGHHHLRHSHYMHPKGLPSEELPKSSNEENEDVLVDMQADAAEGTPSSIGVGLAQAIGNGNDIMGHDVNKKRARRDLEAYGRDKSERLNNIKTMVQQHLGRLNGTRPPGDAEIVKLLLNSSKSSTEYILGRAVSGYPSCEIPKNTDVEAWRDENVLNLYFPIDLTRDTNASIAAAVFKLYRVFTASNSSKLSLNDVECDNPTPDEEKLFRVSVFWYTKSLKRHRVKRRLCDSKVVSDKSKWVELNIMHAIRAWSKGRNLGLAVTVEDQDQTVLKATKFFKGLTCTVGATGSTIFPEPASRQFGSSGRDSPSPTVHNVVPVPPVIQYCLFNASHNYPIATHSTEFTTSTCKIHKTKSQNFIDRVRELQQKLAGQDTNKTVVFNPLDPRNGIQNKQVLYPYQELLSTLNQLSSSNRVTESES